MASRVLAWWEALPARRQVQVAVPVLVLVLLALHEALFPTLRWYRSLGYSLLWGVPGGLVASFATQSELARRRAGRVGPGVEEPHDDRNS